MCSVQYGRKESKNMAKQHVVVLLLLLSELQILCIPVYVFHYRMSTRNHLESGALLIFVADPSKILSSLLSLVEKVLRIFNRWIPSAG